jgi:hypothetical protein
MTKYEKISAAYEAALIGPGQKKSFIRWLRLQYWKHRYNTLTIGEAIKTVQDRPKKILSVRRKRMSIREFMREYKGGSFNDNSLDTIYAAGWYDWFCPEAYLKKRLDKLYPKVRKIVRSKKINIDAMFLLFQNCCPGEGPLYDEFKIGDMETGHILYTVVPKLCRNEYKGRAGLWGRENEFNGPLVVGKWKDIEAYFGIGSKGRKRW